MDGDLRIRHQLHDVIFLRFALENLLDRALEWLPAWVEKHQERLEVLRSDLANLPSCAGLTARHRDQLRLMFNELDTLADRTPQWMTELGLDPHEQTELRRLSTSAHVPLEASR